MLAGLAFLPPTDIPDAFAQWKALMTGGGRAKEFVDYVENNYVLGPLRGVT